jgi:glycerophosphoryl diester phosphodiesterase
VIPQEPASETPPGSFWRGTPRPVVIAHRFGNSAIRARAAEKAGADLLEADVWLHRGRLEVRHSKTAGPLPIIWDRWWIARRPDDPFVASELLKLTSPSTPIMFDLKGRNRRLPAALIELLRQEQGNRQVLVCTQNWRMLEPFRNCPRIETVHSIGSERQLAAAWGVIGAEWYDAISIHNELLTPDVVKRLKSHVSTVITWPVNTEEQLQRVLTYGVDGFTSDSLELMSRIAHSREPACIADP